MTKRSVKSMSQRQSNVTVIDGPVRVTFVSHDPVAPPKEMPFMVETEGAVPARFVHEEDALRFAQGYAVATVYQWSGEGWMRHPTGRGFNGEYRR